MKKILFSATVCSLFMISCNNEMESDLSKVDGKITTKVFVNDVDFQIVNYNGEDCLKFKNDSVYKETVAKLTEMSNEEINAVFSEFNFISQQRLMEEADKEQEAIVDAYEKDPSQPWPYQQITEFKHKYEDVFMFNPYDSTDFIPNYRASMYRYLINRQGLFLIGDSVVNVPQYTPEYIFGSPIMALGSNESTDYNSINKAEIKYQIPNGDYVKARVLIEFVGVSYDNLHRESRVFGFELLSQKKKVLWKKHHADLYLTYRLEGRQYIAPTPVTFSANNAKFAVYGKIDAKNHPVGDVSQNSNGSPRYGLGGTLEVGTNEIPFKGYTTVSLREG